MGDHRGRRLITRRFDREQSHATPSVRSESPRNPPRSPHDAAPGTEVVPHPARHPQLPTRLQRPQAAPLPPGSPKPRRVRPTTRRLQRPQAAPQPTVHRSHAACVPPPAGCSGQRPRRSPANRGAPTAARKAAGPSWAPSACPRRAKLPGPGMARQRSRQKSYHMPMPARFWLLKTNSYCGSEP
jgi:hypothetical protein